MLLWVVFHGQQHDRMLKVKGVIENEYNKIWVPGKIYEIVFSSDARISYFHHNQWFPYWIMIILLNHPTSEWGNGPIHNITMKKLKLLLI